MSSPKPKVLAMSYPAYADKAYMEEFTSKYEIHTLTSTERKGAIPEIAQKAAQHGPFDAILVRMGTLAFEPFDEELYAPVASHCKIVASASAGYNEFDVDWMTRSGIWFSNTRNAVSEATADMSIFLILAILRNASVAEKSAKQGKWRGDIGGPTRDPRNMTLGIIGMGSIGKLLAKKALAFNMKIKYYNRTRLPLEIESEYKATYCSSLDELLASSDIVSVNCPLNSATTGLLGRKEFAKMKDGVYFVNTARGLIVDDDALIEALESGKVKMAGLDVFPAEPEINPYYMASDKCIIQPHIGGLTDDAWRLSELESLENIKACLTTGVPISPINKIEKN